MIHYTTYWLEGQEMTRTGPDEYEIDSALPEPMRQAVKSLWGDFDGATCQAHNHPQDVSPGIGWGLYGDYDEQTRFTECAAVTDGTRTWLVCEDCHAALDPSPLAPEPPSAPG